MKKIKGTPAGIVEIIRKMVADSTCDHDWFLDCEILFVATAKGGMRLNHKSLYALLRELYRAGKIQHKQEKNRHWFRLRTALTGLGWHATTASGGMFFDDRIPYRKGQRSNVVAWLNHKNGVFLGQRRVGYVHAHAPDTRKRSDRSQKRWIGSTRTPYGRSSETIINGFAGTRQ